RWRRGRCRRRRERVGRGGEPVVVGRRGLGGRGGVRAVVARVAAEVEAAEEERVVEGALLEDVVEVELERGLERLHLRGQHEEAVRVLYVAALGEDLDLNLEEVAVDVLERLLDPLG